MRLTTRHWQFGLLFLPLVGIGCFEGKSTPTSLPQVTSAPAASPAPVATSAPTAINVEPTLAPVASKATFAVGTHDAKVLLTAVHEVPGADKNASTPADFLWQPSDKSLIKDEPMTVTPPLGLDSITTKTPIGNPLTKGKFELGRQLYFDPRVSKDGTVSCATCHNPEKGWTDQDATSAGIKGQRGDRSAPSVLNTVYGRTMFWDGRAPSLEAQSQGPPQNPIEMGDQTYQEIVTRLRKIPGYQDQFKKVFGTEVTLDGIAKSVATFERAAALSGNSAYDQYDRGDSPESLKALNDSAKRGMVLFGLRLRQDDDFKAGVTLKKANCTSCHAGQNFTDEEFHNLGVGWSAKDQKLADLGRFKIEAVGAKNEKSIGAFKTPTVRDATRTAPYMHDGSEKTLEAVVEFYDKGGNPNPTLDKDIVPLKLTASEKADLVEFMKALTSPEVKLVLPTLPVGPDGKSPDARAALTPPSAKKAAAVGGAHAVIGG